LNSTFSSTLAAVLIKHIGRYFEISIETNDDSSKYRPISLINTAAKVVVKVLINRIMHHIYTNNLTSKNRYGFTPQTSTVDAVLALKNFVQQSVNEGQYVAVINLDVKGAFDAAWWPGILESLRNLRCPRNLYKLCVSYFNERTAYTCITLKNGIVRRKKVKVVHKTRLLALDFGVSNIIPC